MKILVSKHIMFRRKILLVFISLMISVSVFIFIISVTPSTAQMQRFDKVLKLTEIAAIPITPVTTTSTFGIGRYQSGKFRWPGLFCKRRAYRYRQPYQDRNWRQCRSWLCCQHQHGQGVDFRSSSHLVWYA